MASLWRVGLYKLTFYDFFITVQICLSNLLVYFYTSNAHGLSQSEHKHGETSVGQTDGRMDRQISIMMA